MPADVSRMSNRGRGLLALGLSLLALAVAVAPAASRPSRTHARMGGLELAVLTKLNKVRAHHGLRPLRLNVELPDAAAQHSVAVGSARHFAPRSFGRTPLWKRISRL